ncbi:MAG TPA: C10 family peptidase [Bacteroidales bacterium]|nr:C10 family peptidase [Bacteroidales bacterium]
MKKALFLILLFASFVAMAQPVTKRKATAIAQSFLNGNGQSYTVESIKVHADSAGNQQFFIINAQPESYVIVSADAQLSPILAWSRTSQFLASDGYLPMLESAIHQYQTWAVSLSESARQKIDNQWKTLSKKSYSPPRAQCWPPAGTTSTEGWLETRWTQTAPYNQMCPRDPSTQSASYAGCPAIVMGQIVNYLRTTQNTRFDDSDDYAHNYDGRNYMIDDDAETIGFPSFPVLNNWLDSADAQFAIDEDVTDNLAAAIVFACGTACTQVYTSQGSGTFAVNQAYQAYQRFGFENCELFEQTDSTMYATLIDNLKNGYPAHLAVVDEAWSTGHNVAVDGYREDGYFHINFGWGGQSDGWWLIPDPSFPYSLGVLEGIVLNIIPNHVGLNETTAPDNLTVYPNPATQTIHLQSITTDSVQYSIYSMNGVRVKTGHTNGTISVADLSAGTYLLQVVTEKGLQTAKVVVE